MTFNVNLSSAVSTVPLLEPVVVQNNSNVQDITKLVCTKGYRHSYLEEQLWQVIFCTIGIALIVYPIISLIGHLYIATTFKNENHAYGKIAHYLDEKYQLSGRATFILNSRDLQYMNDIFNEYHLKNSFFEITLSETLATGQEMNLSFGEKRAIIFNILS